MLFAYLLLLLDIYLIVRLEICPRVVLIEVNGHLGPVPVHDLAAAGDPAVLRLLAPEGEVGEVLLLVDRGRHETDLVVTPELRAEGKRDIE